MDRVAIAPQWMFGEDGGLVGPAVQLPLFVEEQFWKPWAIRLHRSSFLHYDLRFELSGRLVSFVLYQAPLLDPKRWVSAKMVGDHDRKYLLSERRIPVGQYGAGPTMPVDHGLYAPQVRRYLTHELETIDQLAEGDLRLQLRGKHLAGLWRLKGRGTDWRLSKVEDEYASKTRVLPLDRSILTGRSLDEL